MAHIVVHQIQEEIVVAWIFVHSLIQYLYPLRTVPQVQETSRLILHEWCLFHNFRRQENGLVHIFQHMVRVVLVHAAHSGPVRHTPYYAVHVCCACFQEHVEKSVCLSPIGFAEHKLTSAQQVIPVLLPQFYVLAVVFTLFIHGIALKRITIYIEHRLVQPDGI